MKQVLAYIISCIISPTIGFLSGILFFPLFGLVSKFKEGLFFHRLFRLIAYIVIGFVSIWIATIIFYLFRVKTSIVLVYLLGLVFILMAYPRIINSSDNDRFNEVISLLGNIIGVILGKVIIM